MHESLIKVGIFDIHGLFTPEVMDAVERITELAKRIPRIVPIGEKSTIAVTPAMATGAIGKIFGLKVKRNIPMRVLHHQHDHHEDILVWNDNVLIVVRRQFAVVPHPVYVDGPSIDPRWKSHAVSEVNLETYGPVDFAAILEIERILRSTESEDTTPLTHRENSYPHCG